MPPPNKRLEPTRLASPVYSCVSRRAAQAQRSAIMQIRFAFLGLFAAGVLCIAGTDSVHPGTLFKTDTVGSFAVAQLGANQALNNRFTMACFSGSVSLLGWR